MPAPPETSATHEKFVPTPDSMEVIVSILVGDRALRGRCKDILANPSGLRKLGNLFGPSLSYDVNHENRPDQGGDLLKQLFLAPGRSVIVISDGMASPTSGGNDGPTATPWWYGMMEAAGEDRDRLGSVAITPTAPNRVADVDRVVGIGFGEPELLDAIARTIRTLDYKRGPAPKSLDPGEVVAIRHVRSPEELREYYRLRHKVYSVMGYLDHEAEAVPSAMEIDWCDLFSVPIAAFVVDPEGKSRMVGTCRIITTRDPNPHHSAETTRIAAEDATGFLDANLQTNFPFQMPFLQSHPDPEILTTLNRKYPDAFCELSRVIVDRDYRGLGLSTRLVGYAMTVARRMGMRRIFLECLPTHRKLYEHFRFRTVPGRRDRVYNINKTMELMEWEGPIDGKAGKARALGLEELSRIAAGGYLCLCSIRECPAGDRDPGRSDRRRYAEFRQSRCPLPTAGPGPSLIGQGDKHLAREWPELEAYYED